MLIAKEATTSLHMHTISVCLCLSLCLSVSVIHMSDSVYWVGCSC